MNRLLSDEKILLVQEASSLQILVQSLTELNCPLTSVSTLEEAKKELQSKTYSLLLLDVVLPDGDGFEYCQQLRKNEDYQNLVIFFLTSKDDINDRVRGFNLGADDYIVKPLEPNEFIARIKSKLLRTHHSRNQKNFINGSFKLDLISQKAYMTNNENIDLNLDLTPTEFKLFSLFLRNEGIVFPRANLKSSVWGPSIHLSDHTIDTHVCSLRKKLMPYSGFLKSIMKQGYVFMR